MSVLELKVLLFICAACLASHSLGSQSADLFPVALTPTSLRLNATQNVLFFMHRKQNITVEVRDASPKRFLLYKDVLTFWSAGPSLVPITLRGFTTEQRAFFTVIDSSGRKQESSVKLLTKAGHAFVQTDKPVYTPREVVRIRSVWLDHDLRPRLGALKLSVKNPQKIIVESSTHGNDQESGRPNFFIDHTFEFPPAPMLGVWQVVLSRDDQLERNVSFEVREYSLPTFAVTLDSPKLIGPSTTIIEGSVKALYVYGKPVDGTVVFTFGIKDTLGRTTNIGRSSLKRLTDGQASYRFRSAEFKTHSWFPEIDGSRFVVEATVTENVTAAREKATTDRSLFASKPYRISFENCFRYFQPSQEIVVAIDVIDATGSPASGVPLSMEIDGDEFPLRTGKYTSDKFGKVVVKLNAFHTFEKVKVNVRTEDPLFTQSEQATEYHELKKQETVDNGYIAISNEGSSNLEVGQIMRTNVLVHQTPLRPTHTFVLIVNKGKIIWLRELGQQEQLLEVYMERSMVPGIRVIALAMVNNKLLAHSISVHVEEASCGLDVTLQSSTGTNVTNPGDSCDVRIKGFIGDVVSLIGVDEAVHVLAKDTRLTAGKVLKELAHQDLGCGPGDGQNSVDILLNAGLQKLGSDLTLGSSCRRHRSKRQISSKGPLVANFEGKGKSCCLLGLSDVGKSCQDKKRILRKYLPRDAECLEAFNECCRDPEPLTVLSRPGGDKTYAAPTDDRSRNYDRNSFVHISYESRIEDETFIRSDFRETWLFDTVIMNKTTESYTTVLPHSITTWSLRAMSLSTERGLCLQKDPVRVTSFKPLFMQVALPYSVVQHEQVEMVVSLFNYGPETLKVVVYMYGTLDVCSEAEPGQKSERKQVVIGRNSAKSVAFALVPLRVGEFEMKVVASSFKGSDVVVKKLFVVPQGTRVEDDYTFQLDPKNQQKRRKRSIKTPTFEDSIDEARGIQKSSIVLKPSRDVAFIVPETQECIVSAIADGYGSAVKTTLSDLDYLIRQPKGCGEQTIIYMAPTLFTLKYLSSVDRLTKEQKERGLRFLRSGVKRELMFRKPSGAFSTFTSRPASVWLTAFVMKIFCQALPFIKNHIDPEVIASGTSWLLKRQDYDGSWTETYPVLHRGIMGGVEGKGPLSAFVLISLRECARTKELTLSAHEANGLESAAQKAESFLVSKQESIIAKRDAFRMALVAYSLTFSPDPNLPTKMINALKDIANTNESWNWMYWRNLFQIETTAYALLALMKSSSRSAADLQAISNFLNAQRKFTGTFDSTQDTVVALEALSLLATSQVDKTDDMKLVCNVSADSNRMTRSIQFNQNNAAILQRFKWRPINENLEFVTQGNGLGLVSVKLAYNVLEPPEKLCRFDIKINVTEHRQRRNLDDIANSRDDDLSSVFSSALLEEFFSVSRRTERFKRDAHGKEEKEEEKKPGDDHGAEDDDDIFEWNSGSRSKRSMTRLLHFSRRNGTSSTGTKRPEMQLVASAPLRSADSPWVATRTGGSREIAVSTTVTPRTSASFPEADSQLVSRLVLMLRVCTFYTGGKKASGMSIVDIGIPSGYRAEKEDLETIISRENLVQKFEQTDRSVIFYLEKIPPARPTCIQFRITRHEHVANLQAAFVKVYDYYTPDDSCSAIFSPTRITADEPLACESSVCRCARDNNCPQGHELLELGEIAVNSADQARDRLARLVCRDERFDFVWMGVVKEVYKNLSGVNRINFQINLVLKGEASPGSKVSLVHSDECDLILQDPRARDSSELVVFGSRPLSDGGHHYLNGTSLVYAYSPKNLNNDAHSNVGKLMSWLQQKVHRSGWSCQTP